MGSDISSLVLDAPARLLPVARLQRRLAEHPQPAIPLLVVRLPSLERTAWREGLRKARSLEKRACAAFAAASERALRSQDIIAHDPGSDVFVAALIAPTRDVGSPELSVDARSALARMCASIETATQLEIDSGWTTIDGARTYDFDDVVAGGLRRGAQERERYAFFSAIGHELRTPLASIRGYLETLLDESIDESTRARFLSIAYRESLRLSRLVEGMFEISLLDLHTTRPNRCSTALDVALHAAIDACAANAAAQSIDIVAHGGDRTLVQIDLDRLTLVLINLIDNAVKHGRPHGRLVITADVADAGIVCVTIDDDGPGIAPSDRERVFTFGERGETPAQGNGIGLALVRLLVERAGGRVDIGDSPQGGARFRVCLPKDTTRA